MHRYLRDFTTAKMTVMKEIHWFDTATGVKPDRKRAQTQKRWADIQAKNAVSGRAATPSQLELRDRARMDSDSDYRRFFTDRFAPDDVFGDVTPSYSRLQSDGFRRMLNVFPAAKIVFLMRNPADAQWSRAAHACKNGGETANMHSIVTRRLAANEQSRIVLRLEDIHDTLAANVPLERIHCIFTEDLFSPHADTVLSALCAFLGIKGRPAALNTFDKNRGHYDPMPDPLRRSVVRHFAPTYRFAEHHMGRLPPSWRDDLEHLA